MNQGRLLAISIIGLWLAAILQQALSPHLSIFGARPDFILVLVSPLSIFVPRNKGAALGFAGGVLQGAIAGGHLAASAISKAVAGFMGSWSRKIELERNFIVVFVTTFVVSLIAGLVWMFVAAPKGIAVYLGDTIGSAMYNGVLAIPVYMLLERVLNTRSRSGL
jgi:rod shape-determining protein MreD